MKSTPFQSLNGRPYKGRIGFGQTVYGLDPRVSKYRPAWKKGIWLDKDDSDMDVIALEGENCAKDFSTMECKHDLGDGSWS